jgi:pyrroline-5-carboxylate reductase
MMKRIAIVGGGNMASALVGGLVTGTGVGSGFDADRIVVADRMEAPLLKLRKTFGVDTTQDNVLAARGADLVILAVKPQDLPKVAGQLAATVKAQKPVILSVAAGIRVEAISAALEGHPLIVRAMPNRPALLGKGITALFASPAVTATACEAVTEIVRAMGTVVWVEREEQMDAVTAVSGSGPAYFFLLMELLEQAGMDEGLPADIARTLAIETAYGAGCMAHEPNSHPATLRVEVTSPGGTTAAALAVLEKADLRGIVRRAVAAAANRSRELAR